VFSMTRMAGSLITRTRLTVFIGFIITTT